MRGVAVGNAKCVPGWSKATRLGYTDHYYPKPKAGLQEARVGYHAALN